MKAMRLCLCVALLAIAGCSTLVPKLEAPRLSIVNIELLKSDLLQQQLRVRMRVQNPNDRALPIRSITYSIEVAGEEFAHGDSDRNFIVPALGETEFDVNVTANAASCCCGWLEAGAAAGSTIAWSARCRCRRDCCAPSRSNRKACCRCASCRGTAPA